MTTSAAPVATIEPEAQRREQQALMRERDGRVNHKNQQRDGTEHGMIGMIANGTGAGSPMPDGASGSAARVATGWTPGWRGTAGTRLAVLVGALLLADAAGAQDRPPASGAAATAPGERSAGHLDIREFGAKGDGSTDDTKAFADAALVVTGHADRVVGMDAARLSLLSGRLSRSNAVELDLPSGRYVLNRTIEFEFGPNTSLVLRGDGSANTQLQFNGGIDGLRIRMNRNNGGNRTDIHRQGAWPGQAVHMSGIQFEANTGIVPAAAGRNSNSVPGGTQAGHAGTAISITGMPGEGASFMAPELFDDIVFTNARGWTDGANNWAGGFFLQDMSNVRLERIVWTDTALGNNTTSIPIWYHSTAKAFRTAGQGNFNVTDALIEGGNTAVRIDGQAIQGVVLDKLFTVGVKVGVSWLAPPNSLTGSLVLADSSMGASSNMVLLDNVSTVFSHHNFFYDVAPPVHTNPVFFSSSGGTTVESDHDTFYGPMAGYEGAGFNATAMFYSGFGTRNPDPSQFSDDIVAHFDNGIVASGGPVAFDDIEVSSDTGRNPATGAATGVCYRDSGTSPDPTQHPIFTNIHCGADTVQNDGRFLGQLTQWNVMPRFAGGLDVGAPGIASPNGNVGAVGMINLHSLPSGADGFARRNHFDVRLRPGAGVRNSDGQGVLDVDDRFTRFNSPVLATAIRYNGFMVPQSSTAPCNPGDSGDGKLHDKFYHFFCTETNRWSRVALVAGGW